MRPLFPFLLWLSCCPFLPLSAQDTVFSEAGAQVESEVTEAVVFLDGAQVVRSATAEVPAGRATLTFTGLTADLDEATLQLSTPAWVDHAEETGRLTWRFPLPPGAEVAVRFGYTVRSPRRQKVMLE